MRLYRFFLGLDTNGANIDAKNVAYALAAECFPHGHTVYDANGRWFGDVGIIDEPTVVIEWFCSDQQIADGSGDKLALSFAAKFKAAANQESVLVTFTDVCATFV